MAAAASTGVYREGIDEKVIGALGMQDFLALCYIV